MENGNDLVWTLGHIHIHVSKLNELNHIHECRRA